MSDYLDVRKITPRWVMMPLIKFTRFVTALVLGLVLSLSNYPAHSQNFPSFENCFREVESYPQKPDLNEHNDRQVYCLFVVELINGGVQPEKVYDNSELRSTIILALRDTGEPLDDLLSDEQIRKLFPDFQELFNIFIDKPAIDTSLFQFSPFPVASVRITSNRRSQSSSNSTSSETRGSNAVRRVAWLASQKSASVR